MRRAKGWSTGVGIELTCVSKKVESLGYYVVDEAERLAGKIVQDLPKHLVPHGAGSDCGGVTEISTPVLHSMEQVEEWYTTFHRLRKRHGAVISTKTKGSGGGHIHFDTSSELHSVKMLRDIHARPWLNWCFNEPCDNSNANNIWLDKSHKWCRKSYSERRLADICVLKGLAMRHHASVLTFRDPSCHLELRIFDAAKTWQEQKLHVEFVQAYVRWVREQPLRKCVKPGRMTLQGCKRLFLDFIEEIGLRRSDYRAFLKNLEERWTVYGKDWLV